MPEGPSRRVKSRGVRRIDNDMIDHQVIGGLELREAMPARAAIRRFVDPTVCRAKKEVRGIAGNGSKRSCISALWTHGHPRLRRRLAERRRAQEQTYQ